MCESLVLADDLSGAAEVGGVAWRFGLSACVHRDRAGTSDTDVLIVDTDSRSCDHASAGARVSAALGAPADPAPRAFKKVDSVLRGPVLAEVKAAMAALGLARALIVPANPAFGRVIRNGRYLIDGTPIEHTAFAHDPEHPARTSDAVALLGPDARTTVRALRPGQALPEEGVVLGEAGDDADLFAWAAQVDARTLAAGAAGFFAAWLTAHGGQVSAPPAPGMSMGTTLFVSGSAAEQAWRNRELFAEGGGAVLPLPSADAEGTCTPAARADWSARTRRELARTGRAMMTIAAGRDDTRRPAQAVGASLVAAAAAVLGGGGVDDVFVDGGATASALARYLRWKRFRVLGELAPGVVAMAGLDGATARLVVKPGSYPWPATCLAGVRAAPRLAARHAGGAEL